jgi:IS30 family transposase/putative SOS response-associated peptidase YedK
MCGRVIQASPPDLLGLTIVAALDGRDNRIPTDHFGNMPARYNGAPSQELWVIRRRPDTGERSLDLLRWGLIPSWCKEKPKPPPINAKGETAAKLPMFREAFARRRCILPIDGFYEWRAIKGAKVKQPYAIAMKDRSPFGLAGLWENWKEPATGEWIRTFCVITVPANEMADSSGRRNTLKLEVAMSIRKRRSARSGRAPLPSPGRPPAAGRDEQIRFWRAIATGLSSEDAALEAGVSQPVGTRWFQKAGGMPPAMFRSSAKPLSGRYLSLVEREEIALLRVQGYSIQAIGRRLGRAASTISRELRRNAATRSGGLEYRATAAQWHADRSARRPKPTKLALNTPLRTYVEERLASVVMAPSGALVPGPAVPWKGRRHGPRKDRRWARAWSPEQIARRLQVDFPDDTTMRISHEAIYQALFVQGRGVLRRELTACLRTGRVLRVPRARVRRRGKGFVSPEIMLNQRPAEAADRAVPGHWEGDLILGLASSAIGTLVERTTRFTMLLHLPRLAGHGEAPRTKNGPALAGHGAEAVRDAITRNIITLPEELRRSLTWDQGAEMAQHDRLKVDAGVQVYFCDPQSPWQRGTNENTNGLLRQYFPKGTDLSVHSADEIAAVAAALNARPRKTLGWRTPAEALDALLYE